MALEPYNTDQTQCLKWMQNNAPNIQALVNQKSDWYSQFHDNFWSNWAVNVFDVRTINTFGIMVWCIILGVPASLFGLYPVAGVAWAFGANRQNYVYEGEGGVPNPNIVGGNFYGGENTTILNIQEARWALMMRYAALVSNGRISFINRMLCYIFNGGVPWNMASGRYFYVMDITGPAQTLVTTAPVTAPFVLEYRVGPNMNFSAQFITALNLAIYGLVPTCAGSKYSVIVET